MEKYIMKGGNPLVGEVAISGAKNAALGIIAASIMTEDDVILDNLPNVNDINVMLEAIKDIGASVERLGENIVKINASNINSVEIDDEYIRKIRASYYFIGALLGRYKSATVPMPGGCAIGARAIDQHLKGFRALGSRIDLSGGFIKAHAIDLVGAHIYLDVVSVGATINIMLASVLAYGKTIIENVAKEPHIVDIANFLNSMGANIKGAGTDVIRIEGVESLHGSEYSIIPDQIEAGTFMCAAAITRGDIIVKNIIPKHMEAISAKLIEMGCEVKEFDDSIRVVGKSKQNSTNIKTLPYPGFPTDMQAQMTTALALAQGASIVVESIFESRFKYVDELLRMGANIKVEGNVAIVNGVENFVGANLKAPDLRAGAALVLAGLSAKGISIIEDIKYIKRGYENFDKKLKNLGADIEIVCSDNDIRKFNMRVC